VGLGLGTRFDFTINTADLPNFPSPASYKISSFTNRLIKYKK